MYAIINKKTNLFVYGTDKRNNSRYIQFTSKDQALTFSNYDDVAMAFKLRKCGRNYKIVKVKLEIIN